MHRKEKRRQIRQANQSPVMMLEASLEIKAADEGDEDSTPTAAITAYNGGPVAVKGYKRPVVIDVQGVKSSQRGIPILQNHDHSKILGHGKVELSDSSINVGGVLSGSDGMVGDVVRLAKSDFPWQASVGLQPTRIKVLSKGAKTQVNGNEVTGPADIVTAGQLLEVSLVPIGADGSTSAEIAAEFSEVEVEYVEDQEQKQDESRDPAPRFEAANTSGSGDKFEAIQARHEYLDKVNEVLLEGVSSRRITAAKARKLQDWAEAESPSIERLELQIIKDGRYTGEAPGSASDKRLSNEVVECSLAKAIGLPVEKQYKEEVLEASHEAYPSGIGLKELINLAARENGYRGASTTVNREMLEFAFPSRALIQATSSGSTYNVSGILSNVANKALTDAFNAVESDWADIAEISSVRDFKQISNYALTGDFTYKKVSPGGEIKHADMGEEKYTNQAETFGRMFNITRHDLINDDLGAFDRVRSKLGRGAALALNEVFWTNWFENAGTFWAAANKNYISGAGTALSIDALTQAELAFRNQVDPDGNPLGVRPQILLVPNALAVAARKLMADTEMRMTDADTTFTTGNPWAGAFRVVVSSYIGDNTKFGGSATNWWLLADPRDLPTIQIVFLNGNRTPIIEQAAANFDQLGIQLRGYHDFGVNKQEFRGSVMSKGAA